MLTKKKTIRNEQTVKECERSKSTCMCIVHVCDKEREIGDNTLWKAVENLEDSFLWYAVSTFSPNENIALHGGKF